MNDPNLVLPESPELGALGFIELAIRPIDDGIMYLPGPGDLRLAPLPPMSGRWISVPNRPAAAVDRVDRFCFPTEEGAAYSPGPTWLAPLDDRNHR